MCAIWPAVVRKFRPGGRLTLFCILPVLVLAVVNLVNNQEEIVCPTVFAGTRVQRAGTILRVRETTVRFLGPYVEQGGYVSDPSTSYFTDLTVGPSGYLSAGTGDVFIVSGDFINQSTQNQLWNTGSSELDFRGGVTAHSFILAGADLGPSYFGYTNNFAWGTLRLASGEKLTLGDGNVSNAGAAFYVTRLLFDGGPSQATGITGNGADIYYDPTDSANAPLLANAPGGIYTLAGGGTIRPVQAVLRILSTSHLTNGHILLKCLGVPGRANTVQVSSDLVGGNFVNLATVSADINGNFSYEDSSANSYPRRFYRLAFP